jgi:hypothetical protein
LNLNASGRLPLAPVAGSASESTKLAHKVMTTLKMYRLTRSVGTGLRESQKMRRTCVVRMTNQ